VPAPPGSRKSERDPRPAAGTPPARSRRRRRRRRRAPARGHDGSSCCVVDADDRFAVGRLHQPLRRSRRDRPRTSSCRSCPSSRHDRRAECPPARTCSRRRARKGRRADDDAFDRDEMPPPRPSSWRPLRIGTAERAESTRSRAAPAAGRSPWWEDEAAAGPAAHVDRADLLLAHERPPRVCARAHRREDVALARRQHARRGEAGSGALSFTTVTARRPPGRAQAGQLQSIVALDRAERRSVVEDEGHDAPV